MVDFDKLTSDAFAIKSKVFHCIDDPSILGDKAWEYFVDGILIIDEGKIVGVGHSNEFEPYLPKNISITSYPNHLIIPGFIDTHIHYPQVEVIGSYGEQLLSWLENYTFPAETKFSDKEYAKEIAKFFIRELLKNGTTTALVFGTAHKSSVDAFFEEAKDSHLRMIAGKVMMDRHAPETLCDTAKSSYEDSKALIEKWHGVDRLQYAVTPRFAPTSTQEQLNMAGQLLKEFEGLYLHTHLSENKDEIAWVKELFPTSKHYVDVYEQAGLLGKRSVFAHGIHLSDHECDRLSKTNSGIAHCPTSNLFLGSGLFPLESLKEKGIKVGLGTDVGGGTSFSMFRTLDEAYKVQQLNGYKLDAFEAFYLATLGGAKVLDLETKVGTLKAGTEADFLILDLQATDLLKFRTEQCQTIHDLLFVLNVIGDDRLIHKTYSFGKCVYQKSR